MLNPGDEVRIRLVKPDKANIEYAAVVLADDGDHLVVEAPWFDTEPRDLGFVRFEPGDVFTEHYWRDRWYSIKRVRDRRGALKGWYCEVARPTRVADRLVLSDDLYLDLWVSGGRRTILRLDEDDFATSRLEETDPATATRARAALDELELLAADGFRELSST